MTDLPKDAETTTGSSDNCTAEIETLDESLTDRQSGRLTQEVK